MAAADVTNSEYFAGAMSVIKFVATSRIGYDDAVNMDAVLYLQDLPLDGGRAMDHYTF